MHLQRNGMGDLVNGWYPVPQNPLNNPGNSLSNPIMEAQVAAKVAGKAKGIGDLVTGNYPVPFNPIVNAGSSLNAPRAMMCDTSNALSKSVASIAAGPTAQLSGFDLASTANMMGMGQADLSTLTADLTDLGSGTTFGYPNWLVYGGGALALWWLFSNKKQPQSSRFHRARRAVGSGSSGGSSIKK